MSTSCFLFVYKSVRSNPPGKPISHYSQRISVLLGNHTDFRVIRNCADSYSETCRRKPQIHSVSGVRFHDFCFIVRQVTARKLQTFIAARKIRLAWSRSWRLRCSRSWVRGPRWIWWVYYCKAYNCNSYNCDTYYTRANSQFDAL